MTINHELCNRIGVLKQKRTVIVKWFWIYPNRTNELSLNSLVPRWQPTDYHRRMHAVYGNVSLKTMMLELTSEAPFRVGENKRSDMARPHHSTQECCKSKGNFLCRQSIHELAVNSMWTMVQYTYSCKTCDISRCAQWVPQMHTGHKQWYHHWSICSTVKPRAMRHCGK